jgi:rare lipoprotein A
MKNILSCLLVVVMLSGCSEIEFGSGVYKRAVYTEKPPTGTALQQGNFKVGKPYSIQGTTYHPKETYEYVESGIASWYGPGFHGKKTASGEIYHQGELTAAHRTLQMPSLVRVTNLSNGRSVIVRVNDRGPFAKGRIIDVSERAAQLLDMVRAGTAKVKVEMLPEESRILAQAARGGANLKGSEISMNTHGRLHMNDGMRPVAVAAPANAPVREVALAQAAQSGNVSGHYTNGRFYPDETVTQMPVTPTGIYVQVGAFGVEDNASRLSTKLGSIANAKVEPVFSGERTLYKVKLGPLQSVREADSVLTRVLTSGHSDAIIVVQ